MRGNFHKSKVRHFLVLKSYNDCMNLCKRELTWWLMSWKMVLLTLKKKMRNFSSSFSTFCVGCDDCDFDPLNEIFQRNSCYYLWWIFFYLRVSLSHSLFPFHHHPPLSHHLSHLSFKIVLLYEKAKHLTLPWVRDFHSLSSAGSSRCIFQFIYFYHHIAAHSIPLRYMICCIFLF